METLRQQPPFDLIVLDPPYTEPIGELLAEVGDVLAPHGVLVLEHARRQPTPETAGRLVRTREVIGGDSALALYEVQGSKAF